MSKYHDKEHLVNEGIDYNILFEKLTTSMVVTGEINNKEEMNEIMDLIANVESEEEYEELVDNINLAGKLTKNNGV